MIAWELGSGLGHLGRHLDLARILVLRGHQVTFAVKDLRLAQAVLSKPGYRYVQAPRVGRPMPMEHPICNHADILDHHGMADASTCMALLQAWVQLFKLCATDVVVLDHSPGALFAAKCLGIKTLELATGFYCPPPQTPYPAFRPWEKTSPSDLLKREVACLAAMNPFAALHDTGSFATLAQALHSDVHLITSFAELDHYPQRVGGHYIGPTNGFSEGEVVNWHGQGKYRIFVYLHHSPKLEQVLTQLGTLDAEVIAYCPELGPNQRRALLSARLNISERPVQMEHVLKDCDLVITNGGHGLMVASVLFAVPALVIPIYLEQRLMADCIKRCGMGLGLSPSDMATRLLPLAQGILDDPGFKAAVLKVQRKYSSFDLPKTLERVANTIERMKARTSARRRYACPRN